MNLVLLDDDDFIAPDRIRLHGRRVDHIRTILRAAVGDPLRVGRVGGALGQATLLSLGPAVAELAITGLEEPPPPPLPVTLVFALPRPPTLRKILSQAAALGVKRMIAIASARVERSYWQSRALEPAAIDACLRLGLEQARDTILPIFEAWPRRASFLRERWPSLAATTTPLLAEIGPVASGPLPSPRPLTLILGPEGGFLPEEREAWLAAGCEPISLGPRPLRVETATVALLGHLTGLAPALAPRAPPEDHGGQRG